MERPIMRKLCRQVFSASLKLLTIMDIVLLTFLSILFNIIFGIWLLVIYSKRLLPFIYAIVDKMSGS